MSAGETKETTTTTTTQEDGGGGGGVVVVNTAPSLASRLNQRADLLRRIFSFHKTRNPKHYINLRSSSKLFHRALHQPPPLWTSFPCSNHATLQSLVDRLEELRDDAESRRLAQNSYQLTELHLPALIYQHSTTSVECTRPNQ